MTDTSRIPPSDDEGRWGTPYRFDRDNWHVQLKKDLGDAERRHGLKGYLSAHTRELLEEAMRLEDAKASVMTDPASAREWNSGSWP